MDLTLHILQDAFWSALAALGFAILFNVPRRALIYCVLGGAIGHAIRTLLMQQFTLPIEFATLLAATVIGFYARFCAVYLEIPSMIFAVVGAIPMVPGVFAYQTMISILRIATVSSDAAGEVLIAGAINAVKTALILAALAVGIVTPVLLFQREKPVV